MSRYRQTMSDLLEQVRNPKQESADYLKSKMTDTQINNIKKTWQMKTAKDVTPAIKKMIKDLDIPTQLAIKHANIPHISKLVEASDDHEISMARGELEAISDKALQLSSMLQSKTDEDELEAWVQSKITKAKDYINSVSDYMTYNPDMANEEMINEFSDAQIKKLQKEYEPMRGKTISVTNANKLGAMFSKFDSNKNVLEKLYGGDIPFISVMAMTRLMTKHNYKAADLNKLRKEEVEFIDEGTGTIKGFLNDKEKSNMVSLAKQHGLKVKDVPGGIELSGNMRRILDMQLATRSHLKTEEVSEGRMSEIDAMVKDGKTAAEIAKALKLNVRDVKAILGEEIEEEKEVKKGYHKMPDGTIMKDTEHKKEEEEPKEDDKEKLKAELEKKEAEIEMLKTKAETEKAKVAKKETEKLVNPETGEPLLQVGIAYKHLKDKMSKQQSEHFEQYMVEYTSQQIKMAYGVANDKRYKGGNYSGAVKAIEKIARGLSNHPDVQKVLKRTNEQLDEMAKDKAYAIGMAAAKKKYNDEPPLEKKTIKKGHEIADKLLKMKKPVVDEGFASDAQRKAAFANGYKEKGKNKKEETIKEYKKMTVTFNSMSDMAKASTDLAKQGFTINAKGMVMKVDGKGADLNKYGTDLQNFYKAKVKAESLDEGKYTRYSDLLIQLGRMKQAKDKQGEMNTQKEIDKEKRKLGINEEHPSKQMFESLAALKKKADKSGMPYSILKKVFDRGMAAWKGGHRPGASQHQWAYARVNSFVTKSSGTWGGADKDLAAKVKGESLEEASLYAFKEYEPSQQYEAGRDMKNIEDAIKKAGGRIKSKEKPTRREPNLSFEIETGNPTAVKAAIKKADPEFNVD
ncbi:hypothetical protein [uncultured virus]|uniref:DUF5824 domain-containing protein n=1 Tax=uncultured virus TaxID=340016 RepID=A0A218MMA6_9VIRU|nr:hypothetical protein [uncultured virus]